jgi:uncharacterized membrane protein
MAEELDHDFVKWFAMIFWQFAMIFWQFAMIFCLVFIMVDMIRTEDSMNAHAGRTEKAG